MPGIESTVLRLAVCPITGLAEIAAVSPNHARAGLPFGNLAGNLFQPRLFGQNPLWYLAVHKRLLGARHGFAPEGVGRVDTTGLAAYRKAVKGSGRVSAADAFQTKGANGFTGS